jgi:hypothetical protein
VGPTAGLDPVSDSANVECEMVRHTGNHWGGATGTVTTGLKNICKQH